MPRPLLPVILLLASCERDAGPVPAAGAPALHDEAFLRAFKELRPDERKHHDPLSILELDPHQAWTVSWPEHPAGQIRRATNDLGFNEDEDTLMEKRGLRILVAGDSHTEGMVSIDESFPNVLERRLRASGRPVVEVLNAGVGYTGPYCYLGVLRKHLRLSPDVFVATVFAGNDFMDDLRILYLLGRAEEPRPDERYYTPLRAAQASWAAACWQGGNQAYRFKRFPEEVGRALDAVEESFAAMQALCSESGVVLFAVVLPTKYDVDLDDERPRFAAFAEQLGLTREEMDVNARLAAELVARLDARGIPCLDATPRFRAEEEPLYWRADHHLNVRGHALLAELLMRELEPLLPPLISSHSPTSQR